MFTEKSWRSWAKALLSLSEKGDKNQNYDIKGMVPIIANCESQLHEAKKGIKNKNPRHRPEDLTQAVVDGTITLTELAKEIDPNVKLPPLEPNPR